MTKNIKHINLPIGNNLPTEKIWGGTSFMSISDYSTSNDINRIDGQINYNYIMQIQQYIIKDSLLDFFI